MNQRFFVTLFFWGLFSSSSFANTENSNCTFSQIPLTPGLYTATSLCVDGDWTHYYIEGDDLLLMSIKSDGIVEIEPEKVTIGVTGIGGFVDLTNVEYATTDVPWIVMNRYWQVTPSVQPSINGVKTRFYFSNSEFEGVKDKVNNSGGNIDSANDLILFSFAPGFNIDPNPTSISPHNGADKNNFIQVVHSSSLLTSDIQYAEFNLNGFSGGGAGGSTISNILPIELVEFQINEVDKKVEVTWTTVSETENEFFTLLHSIDGYNFREIERIAGSGTTNNPTQYKVYDLNPALGINYYRLKQIDFNGRETLSEYVVIKFRGTKYIDIVPTLVLDQVRIDIPEPFDKGATIKVFDSNGRVVYQSTFSSTEQRKTIDFSQLSVGNYLVKVSDGNIFLSKRFIKIIEH